MTLPATGTITMNDIHIEVGGTSGTQCSLNDTDIRALRGITSGQIDMNGFHGLSSAQHTITVGTVALNSRTVLTGYRSTWTTPSFGSIDTAYSSVISNNIISLYFNIRDGQPEYVELDAGPYSTQTYDDPGDFTYIQINGTNYTPYFFDSSYYSSLGGFRRLWACNASSVPTGSTFSVNLI